MRDAILVALLVFGFASVVTVHAAIVVGLTFRAPRWRAVAALVVPPLAPYWAIREHMFVRAGLWSGSVATYVVARIVAGH